MEIDPNGKIYCIDVLNINKHLPDILDYKWTEGRWFD